MIGYSGAPRYAEAIRRLTDDDEIVPPGLILELDRPEWAILKRETLFAFRQTVPAGGGANISMVQVANPGSPIWAPRNILVFQYIGCSLAEVDLRRFVFTTAGWNLGNNINALDGRKAAATVNLITNGVQTKNDVAAPVGTNFGHASPSSPYTGPLILGPADVLILAGGANVAIDVWGWGYFRAMKAEESGDV